MEEYIDIENDTFDACDASGTRDATSTTMKGNEHETEHQAQHVRQLDAKIERKS